MKTEEEIKRLRDIVTLYVVANNHTNNPMSDMGEIIHGFVCFITGHDCSLSKQVKETFEMMESSLEKDGVDINAMIKVKDEIDEIKSSINKTIDTRRTSAKWN